MNFTDFVATGDSTSRSIPINQHTAEHLLATKCTKAVELEQNSMYFYRGSSRTSSDYAIVQPSKYFRISSSSLAGKKYNPNDIFNFLVELLPSWHNWPKRTKSLIFTNSKIVARRYQSGKNPAVGLYHVYPVNDAVIAVCSEDDIWSEKAFKLFNSRLSINYDIMDFNTAFNTILNYFLNSGLGDFADFVHNNTRYNSTFFDENIPTLRNALEQFDNINQKNRQVLEQIVYPTHAARQLYRIAHLLKDLKTHYKGNIISYLDGLLNPTSNGFKLININEIPVDVEPDHEMWTSADCILAKDPELK